MKFCTLIVTRSKSCSVKTLHTILKMNIHCIQQNVQNEILYVNDDPFEKSEMIKKCLSKCDRLFFIDFGINVDEESIKELFKPHDGLGVLVFPGVKDGIDWGLFKHKVREGSKEPVSQMGLNFDTEVGQKVSKDIYKVNSTEARAWVMFSKNTLKKCKKFTASNMLNNLRDEDVKIYAFTASKLIMTYTHECVSNILSAAGVKSN
jgi:hypothetical protein